MSKEEKTIDVTMPVLAAQYMLKGLEALNKQGVTLQESANILTLVTMLNLKIGEVAEDTANQESGEGKQDAG